MTLNLNEFLNYFPKKTTFVLFGEDLSYSISDKIHELIFDFHNLDYSYIFVELKKDELSFALEHLQKYFAGANVTIPYKSDVIPFLHSTEKTAENLNSVNTIHVKDGKLFGYNTDILGIKNTFETDFIDFQNKKVAIIGSGATSNVLAEVIASYKSDFTIFSRNTQTATYLRENTLKNHSIDIKIKQLDEFDDDFDIVCNTTPVGMNNLIGVSPILNVSNAEYVFDVIYNPFYTKLLKNAQENDIKVRNGLRMLLVQAYYSEQIWNNIALDYIEDISANLEVLLAKKRLNDKNIVFLGFMGCGKTHNAKFLSRLLDLEVIDTDILISNEQEMSIKQIFDTYGESHFREIEHEICNRLSKSSNKIISLGGGFAINNPNISKLKENSVFVFIDTDFNTILKRIKNDKSRPLTVTDLQILYDSRYETYKNLADIHISELNIDQDISSRILREI